jgi:glycosyltransferase 2 family protein
MKKFLIFLVIAFTVYSLVALIGQVKFSEVKALLIAFDDRWPLYLLFTLIANLMATFAWIYLDDSEQLKKLPLWELYIIRQAGESLGQLNPTGVLGGDYLKYKLLKQRVDPSTMKNSLYLFRMYSIVSFFWIVALSFATYVIFYEDNIGLPHILLLVFLVSIIIFLFKILKKLPSLVLALLNFSNKYFGLKPIIVEKFGVFTGQIAALKFSRKHMLPNILLVLHWIIGSLEVYGIMKLLNLNVPPLQSVIMEYGIMAFKTVGQVIPAQLGIEEVGNSYMLLLFGSFTSAVWLGFSIMRRIRQLFWIFLSLLYLWYAQLTNPKN